MTSSNDPSPEPSKPRLRQLIGSVLSAAVGIQSSKNHARDFKHGKLPVFVAAGIIFVAVFIAMVYAAVSLVLQQAH
jgi:hypothetical protein